MPTIESAKKELRKNKQRQLRNKKAEDNLEYLIKKSRQVIADKKTEAKEMLAKTLKALDEAAQRGLLKKNTANRKKSRLQKQYNQTFKVGSTK